MRRFRGRLMFNSLAILAVEANHVVGLRMMKLMRGGRGARREAKLMISEKIDAAAKAGASLMAGASGDEIVRQYRKRVAANAKRLSNARTLRRRK
jgi:hypothetical protein